MAALARVAEPAGPSAALSAKVSAHHSAQQQMCLQAAQQVKVQLVLLKLPKLFLRLFHC
jgi:hypothetical protein